jgi:hypothetical protein
MHKTGRGRPMLKKFAVNLLFMTCIVMAFISIAGAAYFVLPSLDGGAQPAGIVACLFILVLSLSMAITLADN